MAELARVFGKPLATELTEEIHRCWPPDRGQLNRARTKHFRLDVRSEPLLFSFKQHSNALQMQPPKRPVKVPDGTAKYLSALTRRGAHAHKERYFDLAEIGSSILFSAFDRSAFYVPASRSGFVRGYGVMTDRAMERLEWRDGGQPAVHLPGVDLDFMRYLLRPPQTSGPFVDLAAEMAKELIKGDIVLMWTDKNLPPDILYKFGECEVGLERASSGVCDLTPLLLLVSRSILPGDLVIIDEPEAHLHPGAIRILAKYMVRLVREGVNLIITTHSDYLLEQLNNFILLGKVDPERRKEKYNDYEVDDFLKPEQVGAYVFNYDEQEKGYVTEKLVIDEDEGLIEEEFNKVNEALYDELASLRRDVARKSTK